MSHLFFADDILFFLKASTQECSQLRDCLNSYCVATCQNINFQKSCIFFSSNTPQNLVVSIFDLFTIPPSGFSENYLGFPSEWGQSRRQVLNFIRERVQKSLGSWLRNFLSPAGKEILSKYVVQAIPAYTISIFKMPKSLCKEVMLTMFWFWWNGGQKSKGVHWVRREELLKPKFLEGLGFRDLISFNSTLLAKQAWRFYNEPNSLWVCILSGIYLSQCSFLNAKKPTSSSWTCHSLLHGRDTLQKFARWRVGNGHLINNWCDKWGLSRVYWADYRVEGFDKNFEFLDPFSGFVVI